VKLGGPGRVRTGDVFHDMGIALHRSAVPVGLRRAA
jgi:hypothetical protein